MNWSTLYVCITTIYEEQKWQIPMQKQQQLNWSNTCKKSNIMPGITSRIYKKLKGDTERQPGASSTRMV